MKVALTGHRPQRLGLPEDETNKEWRQIRDWVIDTLHGLMYYKQELHMYSGMADGCRSISNANALKVRNGVLRKYGIQSADLTKEIHKYQRYSSQRWIDEYNKLLEENK